MWFELPAGDEDNGAALSPERPPGFTGGFYSELSWVLPSRLTLETQPLLKFHPKNEAAL